MVTSPVYTICMPRKLFYFLHDSRLVALAALQLVANAAIAIPEWSSNTSDLLDEAIVG